MPDDSLTFRLDGQHWQAHPGQPLIEVLLARDAAFPHLCYHPNLGVIQTCDTCIVEVNGELVRACATPTAEQMVVYTRSPRAKSSQAEAMQRILANHRLYCTVCDNNNGNCEVHNTTKLLQIQRQTHPYSPKPYPPIDDSNPFYRYDVNQCILCGRCVEACQDLEVNETLRIDWSLKRPRVVWDDNQPIGSSSCVSCGHCVSVCPCNALMEKSMLGQAGYLTAIPPHTLEPMIEAVESIEPGMRGVFALSDIEAAMRKSRIERTKTVCTYCGVGCSFEIWTRDRHILKIEPSPDAPVNGISTCVKGKFGWDFVNSQDRLTQPLIREGDHFRPAGWEEALTLIGERMSNIRQRWGPDAFMFVASSKGSNEEAYLTQKLARAVIGTNNVDNDSTYCQDPATQGLRSTVGYGADSGSLGDIENADLIIIIGSNTAESHPVFATRIKRGHKLRDQKLVVVDLRRHEMARRADLFIRPNPSTDLYWILGLSKYMADQGWIDRDFLAERVNGYDAFLASLDPYTLQETEIVTGIPREETIRVAEMIHAARGVAVLWAMGVTQQRMGSETSTAICNLLLLTGNFGRTGTGGYPLRGHNNVQGASDSGAKPKFFPGYQPIADASVRARFEKAWGVPLSWRPGCNNQEITGAIESGQIKCLYVVGEDTALVDADASSAQAAFSSVEFMVVQELFLTRTAQYADVVLPACPSLEKEGTFTNTERRIQRFYQALPPLGESRPDWHILTEVARQCGADWTYTHPSQIMEEMSSLAPIFAGVRYDRLEGYHTLCWPVQADGQDEPLLYRQRFHFPDGKARLIPVAPIRPNDFAPAYDIHVNNGQLLEHFHEGNMTYRVAGIADLVPSVFLEVSAELAQERSLQDGTRVRLISPTGTVDVPVIISDRVRGREVYLPMNDRGPGAVNFLTGVGIDATTDTPAFKDCAVRMEVLDPSGESPLPRKNWRNQIRYPQLGVEVERKWRRPDYVPLTTGEPDFRPEGEPPHG